MKSKLKSPEFRDNLETFHHVLHEGKMPNALAVQ